MHQGRDREAAEVVHLRRAAEVGRLMLGELNEPLRPIQQADYVAKTRRELKAEVTAVRAALGNELQKFCRQNFVNVEPEDLAALYDDILTHQSEYRLPLQDFISRVGKFHPGVLKGAPAHATVHLSLWGLQTEFPEMHLARDLVVAYNDALDAQRKAQAYEGVSWRHAKDEMVRGQLAAVLRRAKYSMRMCLLSCFNLTEAFINGIAWEFITATDVAPLSKNQHDLLTKGQASLLDKLVKIPAIVKGQNPGPLAHDQDPLLTFRELVKPFRDSIVHASPFSAAQRFGGYDKLARVYELEMPTVTTAVDLTLRIIGIIHEFLNRESPLPTWVPVRGDDGRFVSP